MEKLKLNNEKKLELEQLKLELQNIDTLNLMENEIRIYDFRYFGEISAVSVPKTIEEHIKEFTEKLNKYKNIYSDLELFRSSLKKLSFN